MVPFKSRKLFFYFLKMSTEANNREAAEEPNTNTNINNTEKEVDGVVRALEERIDTHDESRRKVQEKLHEICEKWRRQIDELEEGINSEIEAKFKEEDSHLQAVLSDFRRAMPSEEAKVTEALRKAKAELLVIRTYQLKESKDNVKPGRKPGSDGTGAFIKTLKLSTKFEIDNKAFDMSRPENVDVTGINGRWVHLKFTRNLEQEKALFRSYLEGTITYKALLQKKGEESGKEYVLRKKEKNCFSFVLDFLEAEAIYTVKVKGIFNGKKESEWSEEAEFIAPMFSECCVWKECPGYVDKKKKYSVDEKNPRTATKIGDSHDGYGYGYGRYDFCTIIGNAALPQNKVTSWNIKILKSKHMNGSGIYIGVAPFDINQNEDENCKECGWYFGCCDSTLCSGPPHNYKSKEYGKRKREGQYVHTGDSVGVVMDTTKGELSFAVDGVNHGVAYDGIPLDKPLMPCVFLYWKNDSVELII